MSWRPEGWKNPYDVSIGGDALRATYLESNLSDYKVKFEQGADAMLKAMVIWIFQEYHLDCRDLLDIKVRRRKDESENRNEKTTKNPKPR